MSTQIIFFLIIAGCFSGFIAGLLGVGGGIIVVPVTLWALELQGITHNNIQHIAIGTSFGVMLFTTFSSMLAQQKNKVVIWSVVKSMVIGTSIGTIIGSTMANYIPSKNLQILFVVFCYAIATKTFFHNKVTKGYSELPKNKLLTASGFSIGLVSSLLGIGGGVLNVPFLLFFSVPMKNAVGISSTISFFISIFGFISYVYLGWSVNGLPPYSLGYTNLPITATMAIATIVFAPLGVKASHKLPASILKKIFAVLVLVVGTKILLS